MNTYTLLVKNSQGAGLASLGGFIEFTASLAVNSAATLDITLPDTAYNSSFFAVDNIVEVWRSVDGRLPYLFGGTAYLMRLLRRVWQQTGERSIVISCLDMKDILARRIVAYADQTAQAAKLMAADDMAKQYVNENLDAGAADAARNLGALMTVAPNLTAAPVISESAPHRKLSDVLLEIVNSSYSAGTYLAYDIVYDPSQSQPSLTFNTYTGQRGVDHRFPSSTDPVYLDPELAMSVSVELDYDYRDMRNYIYAGGAAIGPLQPIQSASDPVSIGLGPFNRVEEFVSATDRVDPNGLLQAAYQALRNLRARRTYTTQVVNTPALRLGVNYDYGDFLTTSFASSLLDTRLDGLSINVKAGVEMPTIVLKADS